MRSGFRTLALGLFVISLMAGNAFSQGFRMSPEERVAQLTKQLSLTDEQKTQVLEIFKKSDESRRAAFEKSDGDRDAMRETMQQIRADADKKLKELLTEEQYAKYVKLRSEAPRRPRN